MSLPRFKIYYKKDGVKTGLRFNFYDGIWDVKKSEKTKRYIKIDDHIKERAMYILEEDVFTFEPVFYKIIKGYENYGHWGRHALQKEKIKELLSELSIYSESVKSRTERQYEPTLTESNYGSIYKDIDENRDNVISLIEKLCEWLNQMQNDTLTIMGI